MLHGGMVVRLQARGLQDVALPQPLGVFDAPEQGCIFLSTTPTGTQGNLRIKPNGQIDYQGMRGKFALFALEPSPDNTSFALRSVGANMYLGLSGNSTPIAATGPYYWQYNLVSGSSVVPAAGPMQNPREEQWFQQCALSREQMMQFKQNGFMHFSNMIPQAVLNEALRSINADMARPAEYTHNKDLFGVKISTQAQILNLVFNSPVFAQAQQFLGRGRVIPPKGAQVALRFPKELGFENGPAGMRSEAERGAWHIDGFNDGKMTPFSLLVGIALSDQPEENYGNLVVYPGSHHLLCQKVHEIATGRTAYGTPEFIAAARDTYEPPKRAQEDWGKWTRAKPDLSSIRPIPIKAKAGDVVFVHQKVAHRIGLNISPHIRYQVYFRLRTHAGAKNTIHFDELRDPFHEFVGLQ